MRILYVAYRFPYPPDKGERIRSFAQIRHLGANAEVHVVCPGAQSPGETLLEPLRRHCASVTVVPDGAWAARLREAARLATGAPRMTGTFNSRALRAAVERVAARHDVQRILVSSLHVAEAVRGLRRIPTAIDLIDVYSALWHGVAELQAPPISWLSRLEGDRLRRYEATLAEELDAVILTSAAEAATFREDVSRAPVNVVGNGVDLDYFRSRVGEPSASAATAPARPTASTIVFTGQMDYAPNVDGVRYFCRDVLPGLRAQHEGLRFTIVGRDPVRAVRALAQQPGVEVTGAVGDVRGYLEGASVAVAPLRAARGIQNKVIEAMAMGVPVVATPAALAGLERDHGDGAQPADDPATFVRTVDRLLRDSRWRHRCALAARAYVERSHRWEDHGARLLAVLEGLDPSSATTTSPCISAEPRRSGRTRPAHRGVAKAS